MFPRQNQGRIIKPKIKQRYLLFFIRNFFAPNKTYHHIIEGGLTATRYLEILENVLLEILEDVCLAQLNHIYYQQDGASAHNARKIWNYLDRNLEAHWIGIYEPVLWPPRSPDFSIMIFFLLGISAKYNLP